MKMRVSLRCFIALLAVSCAVLGAQTTTAPTAKSASARAMDHDLMEVTVPRLETMYRRHKYTVKQVVEWYQARIDRYNGIYRAVQYVDWEDALETAAREDAEAQAGGPNFHRGPLWGVP